MYAQVIKSDMRVNLIGGEEEGLPIEHTAVICVDIGERTDVELGMKYDVETGNFSATPSGPSTEPPSIESRVAAIEEALLTML